MRQSVHDWPDGWNPVDLLQESHLACIIGMDTVRAVGADPNGSPADIIISVDSSVPEQGARPRQDHNIPISDGEAKLATLLGLLTDVFSTTGNTHWGDATDARLLSDALGIGFFIFADKLQDKRRCCLYSMNQLRGDFPFFINIWWDEPVHFRAAAFQTAPDAAFDRCYAQSEVPEFLQDQFNWANRSAPFGRPQQAM